MRLGSTALALLAMLAVLPGTGFGHAVVTRASLGDAPIPADTAREVTLHFNSGIESRLTRVVLVRESGGEQALELGDGGAPNELRVKLPPLAAGRYGLRYKVLAADGHVTEDVLRFQVGPR